MLKDLTREELFLLVWERPSQEIARELGISDVALAKRCRKLQVPKPTPGYWAKIKAGKRPQKPLLEEFSERLALRQKAEARKNKSGRGWIGLSSLQIEIFRRAIAALSAEGINLGELEITRTGARGIRDELAAQILLVIQHHHAKWLEERPNHPRVAQGAMSSLRALVGKLLPLAQTHTLILSQPREKHDTRDRGPKIVIRLTPEFNQQVANLRRLVIENNLSFVVWDLQPFEHTWIVQYHLHYDDYARARSQLCISREFLWVDCHVIRSNWREEHEEKLQTSKITIDSIAPVELIPSKDIIVPPVVDPKKLSISKKRIKAFVEVDQAYDILSSAVYRHDFPPAPDDHLVLLEKLGLGSDARGPLTMARAVCRKLEDDLERWELAMESEREAICAEALGLAIGDTILTECRGKSIRLKIKRMSMHLSDKNTLYFHIGGLRYRKDGLLGKRDEYIYISTDSDRN